MNNERSFQRLAGVTAIISAPLAFGSLVLSLAPVDFNVEVFSDMVLFISVGASGANLLRWAWVLDILGFYLLIAPVAFVLWYWLKPRGPARVGFYTFCGLAYMLIGAIGAAILAAVWPPLIIAYPGGSGLEREILEAVFSSVTDLVYGGLWGLLLGILAGVWWLGIGLLLRSERRILGVVTIILGIGNLLAATGGILNLEDLAMPGLFVELFLAPIWALWLGIDILRRPPERMMG